MKLLQSIKIKKIMLALVIGLSIFGVGKYMANRVSFAADPTYVYWQQGTPWHHKLKLKGKNSSGSGISNKNANTFTMYRGTSLGSNSSKLLVFCAFRGKEVSSSSSKKEFLRKTTNEFFASAGEERIKKLNKLLYLMEPGGVNVSSFKSYLQTNYPTQYTNYGWSSLSEDEIYSAMVGSIWIIINKDRYFLTESSSHSKRTNNLMFLLSQGYFHSDGVSASGSQITGWGENPGELKNISTGSGGNTVSWAKKQDVQKGSDNKITFKIEASGTIVGSPAFTLKTDTGATIASGDYSFVPNGNLFTFTFGSKFTFTEQDGLKYNNNPVKNISVSIVTTTGSTKTAYAYYRKGVTTSYLKGSYQYFVGVETTASSVTSQLTFLTEGSPIDYEVYFDKLATDDESKLENAHLILERVFYIDNVYTNPVFIEEWNTSKDSFHTVSNLSAGFYRITEGVTPLGYTFYNGNYGTGRQSVDGSGYRNYKLTNADNVFYVGPEDNSGAARYTTSAVGNTDTYRYYVHMYNQPTLLKINKVEKTNESQRIGNATFVIVDGSGQDIVEFTTSDVTSSDFSIGKLFSEGYYFLIETIPPVGHVPYTDSAFLFKVGDPKDQDGKPIPESNYTGGICQGEMEPGEECEYRNLHVVTRENPGNTGYDYSTDSSGSITIKLPNLTGYTFSKVDIDDTSKNVPGASLKITNTTGTGADAKCVTGDDQIVYESWVSGNTPYATTKYYTDGKYCLVESIPAPGYASAESKVFTISNGKVTETDGSVMKDAPLNICVYKKASNVSGNLAGAKFELRDSSNRLIDTFTTTSDGPYCFLPKHKLEVGKVYTLKEIEAPAGYKAAANTTFTVRDTADEQKIEIEDEVVVPQTAMSPSSLIYIAVLVMGVVGIGMVCYYVKRYNY